MKILITGATGLVGKEIVKLCQIKNYDVHYLTTRKSKITKNESYQGFYWNPSTQEIDKACLTGVHAILNLAGASVSKKWTNSYKKEIEDSRIDSIKLLFALLKENENQVSYFTSASAMGVYPSSLDRKYSETETNINDTFLGQVVAQWEREIDRIGQLNIKVSKLRIGVVLSGNGGALPEMARPIKWGVGAVIGSGEQYQSWIHIEDLAKLFLYVTETQLVGVYNAVSSQPSTNEAMTKAIAKSLNRPLWLPKIPSFMIKLLLGEMSAIVLESQFLINDEIKSKGFEFTYDSLEKAIEDIL